MEQKLVRGKFKIIVCRGPECGDKRNSRAVYTALSEARSARGVCDRTAMDWHSCFGRCTQGPNVLIREVKETPEEQRFVFAAPRAARGRTALYNGVTPRDALELIDEHVVGGRAVRRLIVAPARGQSAVATTSADTDGDS